MTKVAQGKGLNQDSNLELRFQSLYFAISKGQLIPEKKKKKELKGIHLKSTKVRERGKKKKQKQTYMGL